MCGIIGIIGNENIVPSLVDALKRLEYRGYDSAGVATLINGTIHRRRVEGKLTALENALATEPLTGNIGIGHTRWATHGAPSATNAHPHSTDHVSVVHNGIIENFQSLRTQLEQHGMTFTSDTDTEVIPQSITYHLSQGLSPKEAVARTVSQLEGAFAIAILFKDHPDLMFAARKGSPLALGVGDNAMYVASDAYVLAPLTNRIIYLEDGDWVELHQQQYTIFTEDGEPVERPITKTAYDGATIGKGNYRHFMLKEIYEQPGVIADTLNAYIDRSTNMITLPEMPFDLRTLSHITIIACGTSYYAGMIAKYWIEQLAHIPVELDIASEFRYRQRPLIEGGAVLCISQSGETADTLAALQFAKSKGQHTIAIVNVEESSMARIADITLRSFAGPEIGVASTKAFTTQLVVLATFSLHLAEIRDTINQKERNRLERALAEVPARVADILNHDDHLRNLAHRLTMADNMLYIGRGTSYAIALEGALKLKELSYVHAEGVAAGELKHGPIALIDDTVPVIVIAPSDALFEKTASNVQEVASRGANVVFLSDHEGVERLATITQETIELPTVDPFVTPILYAIPIQLLAYHVAVHKGTDVDQPRNLAKSVTVE